IDSSSNTKKRNTSLNLILLPTYLPTYVINYQRTFLSHHNSLCKVDTLQSTRAVFFLSTPTKLIIIDCIEACLEKKAMIPSYCVATTAGLDSKSV
ncbi:hypothetical protein T310_8906, partial [Rasamsonia emersonii CBS 393.64]